VNRGSLEQADRAVRGYLNAHPDSADGHFLLGLIRFKQGNPRESLFEYTEGAKHHNPGAPDLKIVALNYVLLGDYSSADRWLTRSLQANRKDSEAWYYLARTKYNENRFDEARSAFQECLKLDPKNVKAEDNLGLSQQALGHTTEALTAFRNAIAWQSQLLKKNSGPFINLGILFLEQNQVEEAVAYLSEAVAISPEESRAHEQLGKAYSRKNDLEKAQYQLEKAVALSPDSASLHFMLGQLYRKRGMNEKAKAELERGAALNAAREQPEIRQVPD
jgi:tetratricopeptide (TPR) repeat protein